MNRWIIGSVALAMLVAVGNVEASVVIPDPGSEILGPLDGLVTFDEEGVDAGQVNGGVLTISNVEFGERFFGQDLTISSIAGGDAFDGFDVLGGVGDNPLTTEWGADGENIEVLNLSWLGGNVLIGRGAAGQGTDQVGEGAISILFPVAQTLIAFDVVGANGGAGFVDFYAGDGSHLGQYVVQPLADGTQTIDAFALNLAAPFLGITVTNLNSGGAGIDNLRFSTTAAPSPDIPEPASLVIWSALALLGITVGWRRRKQA